MKSESVSHSVVSDSLVPSVHGILQARILEWGAIPFSWGSFPPRDQPRSPTLQADSSPFESPGKPMYFPHLKKKISFQFRSPQSTEQNSLCYTVGSQQLSILYIVEYISQFQSLNSSYSSFPPWYPYICSLCLCLYFCFASKIIYTIFLDLLIIF